MTSTQVHLEQRGDEFETLPAFSVTPPRPLNLIASRIMQEGQGRTDSHSPSCSCSLVVLLVEITSRRFHS